MKQIFESVKMNHIKLENRLIRSATWEGIAAPDGSLTSAKKPLSDRFDRKSGFLCCFIYMIDRSGPLRQTRVRFFIRQLRKEKGHIGVRHMVPDDRVFHRDSDSRLVGILFLHKI